MTDLQLLSEFTRGRSREAFAAIVDRHVDLVYSTAKRIVRDPHLAEDVTQVAFAVLARKASTVDARSLAGWLVNATRLSAREAIRSRATRERHEQRASRLRSPVITPGDGELTSEQLTPLLDEALSHLGERDRSAIVLRFLQGMTLAQVAERIGSTEDAAQKRVGRALAKLRAILTRGAAAPSLGGLAVVLAAHQARAAPAGLAATVSPEGSVAVGATAGKVGFAMRWAKIKMAACVGVLAMAGTGGAMAAYRLTGVPGQVGGAPAVAAQTRPATVDLGSAESAFRSMCAAVKSFDAEALARTLRGEGEVDEKLNQAWAACTVASAKLNAAMASRFGGEALLDEKGERFIDAWPLPSGEDKVTSEPTDNRDVVLMGTDELGWGRLARLADGTWRFDIACVYGTAEQRAEVTGAIEAQAARMAAMTAEVEAGRYATVEEARAAKKQGCEGGRVLLAKAAVTGRKP